MRLICPKCGAQYEVDDSVIPEGGRDVQCSDCGTAWFQKSAAAMAAEADARRAAVVAAATQGLNMEWAETSKLAGDPEEEAAREAPPAVQDAPLEAPAETPVEEPVEELAEEAPAVPEPQPAPQAEPELPKATEPEGGPAVAADEPQVVFKRRAIDETTLNVLREEAEREAQARRDEEVAMPARSEPDEPERSLQARAEPGIAAPAEPAPQPRPTSGPSAPDEDRQGRKELLPDIEEIKSTLRSTSDRPGEPVSRDAPEVLRRQRVAFRKGFIWAVAVIALLALLYALAPSIVSAVPGSEAVMAAYVRLIDGLRDWLQSATLAAAEAMGGPSR